MLSLTKLIVYFIYCFIVFLICDYSIKNSFTGASWCSIITAHFWVNYEYCINWFDVNIGSKFKW